MIGDQVARRCRDGRGSMSGQEARKGILDEKRSRIRPHTGSEHHRHFTKDRYEPVVMTKGE